MPVIVNSRRYDLGIRRTWSCDLVRQDGPYIELEGVFDLDIDHPELGSISRGTTSVEYYWLDRWYNIFRFHTPAGALRNYYCNINMPPTFAGGVLDYVDLDIDIVVWPDGSWKILDRDEFEENALKYGFPAHIRASVESTLDELISMIESGKLPQGA